VHEIADAGQPPLDARSPSPAPGRGLLVLLRHGESEWNRDRLFTGWTDVDLSPAGMAEAARAGERLRGAGYRFDRCYTSVLRRATRTTEIVLRVMGLGDVPVERSWRLNERHYGALQGLGTWRAVRRHGLLPVLRCQYRFAARPPALEPGDPRHPGRDSRYASLDAEELPRGESHADIRERLMPYWLEQIAPECARGRRILIVSHKNTLRALMLMLERRHEAEVRRIRVPTGVPIVFVADAAHAAQWRRLGEP
jgi:2,3-bisphosphoglycerate-dependent phosphoglycerate mutase